MTFSKRAGTVLLPPPEDPAPPPEDPAPPPEDPAPPPSEKPKSKKKKQ